MKSIFRIMSAAGLIAMIEAQQTASLYSQCGGAGWTGATKCGSGQSCQTQNAYYAQCLTTTAGGAGPITTTTTSTTSTPISTPPTQPPVTGSGKSGSTTRYWDCCKPSCSWRNKANVLHTVDTCDKNGNVLDPDTTNSCNGANPAGVDGPAFMCSPQMPWRVDDNTAYGFAAYNPYAQTPKLSEQDTCCSCYALTFTNGPVAGKSMIVQITNTGDDLKADQFDLAIPGGGVGYFESACQAQWGAPKDGWGDRYGGVQSASGCASLPQALQPGCYWRFDWFKGANNPDMTYTPVTCPDAITSVSKCKRA